MTRFRDFTISTEPITFKVGPDVFTAHPILATVIIGELVTVVKDMETMEGDQIGIQLSAVGDLFKLMLTDDCADRFVERLSSRDEPLDLKQQVIPIMFWLMEEYGLRPTEPSTP
ncbi:MAG: hypothetical protein ACRD4B_08720 [Acidobacteriota bacterium]